MPRRLGAEATTDGPWLSSRQPGYLPCCAKEKRDGFSGPPRFHECSWCSLPVRDLVRVLGEDLLCRVLGPAADAAELVPGRVLIVLRAGLLDRLQRAAIAEVPQARHRVPLHVAVRNREV